MSSFTVFWLCVHACLIQAVFGCGCGPIAGVGYGAAGLGLGNIGYGNLGNIGRGNLANTAAIYGGEGLADISVAGVLDVTGKTYVTGQIPVLGQVGFSGTVPAWGAGTIFGSCGSSCGCRY